MRSRLARSTGGVGRVTKDVERCSSSTNQNIVGMSVDETAATMTANTSHTLSTPLGGVCVSMHSQEYTKPSPPMRTTCLTRTGSSTSGLWACPPCSSRIQTVVRCLEPHVCATDRNSKVSLPSSVCAILYANIHHSGPSLHGTTTALIPNASYALSLPRTLFLRT